jgi:hypothetical protein
MIHTSCLMGEPPVEMLEHVTDFPSGLHDGATNAEVALAAISVRFVASTAPSSPRVSWHVQMLNQRDPRADGLSLPAGNIDDDQFPIVTGFFRFTAADQPLTIGRKAGVHIVGIPIGEGRDIPAIGGHHVNVPPSTAVGAEGNPPAVTADARLHFIGGTVGQLHDQRRSYCLAKQMRAAVLARPGKCHPFSIRIDANIGIESGIDEGTLMQRGIE